MATNKKAVVKQSKPSKSTPQPKAVSKSPVKDKKAAMVQKHAAKATAPKKATAVKATKAPAKAVAKKATVASKPASVKKAAPPAKSATAHKPAIKAPVKNIAKPAVKAAPKKAPATKPVVVAKKAAPAPVKKASEKKVETAKKPVAAQSKVVAKPAPQVEKVAKPKKAPKPVKIVIPQAPKPQPKPAPTPAAYLHREEKKSNIIVAHRRLENKSKDSDTTGITMMNFQPEFTRSILDGPEQQPTGPVYRYSDEELAEFRELITNRLESARKELNYLQGLITRKDEAGTEDTENRYMNMEDGSGAMEREQLAQLASRQIQFINHLEKAMIRIENKTYGICRVTGNLIDKARLRAVPHATLSIEAKKLMASK